MAAGGGTISYAGWHGGHGRYVMIRHNKELATAYAHMSQIAVKPGQKFYLAPTDRLKIW